MSGNPEIIDIAEVLGELASDLEDASSSLENDETPSNCASVAEDIRSVIQNLQVLLKRLDELDDEDKEEE